MIKQINDIPKVTRTEQMPLPRMPNILSIGRVNKFRIGMIGATDGIGYKI